MAGFTIRTYPDPILAQKAEPVQEITDATRQVLDEMATMMYASSGIGLAAPQVGIQERIIVVDHDPDGEGETLIKLVNPVILLAEGSSVTEEGCLSIPGISEVVRRAEKVLVEAYNEHGKMVKIEAEALLATVLQHEIDHLNGILFIDRLSRLKRNMIRRKLRKRSYNILAV